MNIFPFGDIPEDKYKICIDYKLLERAGDTGIWRLTQKCKANYEPITFIQWLEGKRDKPMRVNKKEAINELLKL